MSSIDTEQTNDNTNDETNDNTQQKRKRRKLFDPDDAAALRQEEWEQAQAGSSSSASGSADAGPDSPPAADLLSFDDLPMYLRPEPKFTADRGRITHYFPNRLASGFSAGRMRPMICLPSGLWQAIDTRFPLDQDGVESLTQQARAKAVADLEAMEGAAFLAPALKKSFVDSPSHYLTLMRHMARVASEPEQFGIRKVGADEIDNRKEHPILPLKTGGGIHLRTGERVSAEEMEPMMLLDHGWDGAVEPAFELVGQQLEWSASDPYLNRYGALEVDVTGRPAAVMNYFIYEHIGIDCLRRIAWSIGGIWDVLDTVSMPPSGSGKGTLIEGLKLGLGHGAVTSHMASKAVTSKASERFTAGTDDATHAILVIIDEADKATMREHMTNELCDDEMSVHKKGQDLYSQKRIGNVWLFGGGWPQAEFESQGVARRLRWAWEVDKTAISASTRSLLLQPEAIRYLLAVLITEAVQLAQVGSDGACDESAAALARWKKAVSDQTVLVLASLRDPSVTDQDFTPNDDLRTRLADCLGVDESSLPSEGRAWSKLIRRVFPRAVADRKSIRGRGQVRGWVGVKLLPEDSRADEEASNVA